MSVFSWVKPNQLAGHCSPELAIICKTTVKTLFVLCSRDQKRNQ
jgi:hypothetical protein